MKPSKDQPLWGGDWGSPQEPADATPSLATALRQVGLRLEPTKAPVDILVIDHIERPGEN